MGVTAMADCPVKGVVIDLIASLTANRTAFCAMTSKGGVLK